MGYLLGFLEFLSASHTLGLVLGAPQLGFGVGLGELALKISLALGLLLYLLAQVVQVVLQVAEFAQKGSSFLITRILLLLITLIFPKIWGN